MKTFSITEAREKLSEVLGLVRYGDERIQLTHHGHPVAYLTAINPEEGDEWTGARWILGEALRTPESKWAVIAPTYQSVRERCFEGPLGILNRARALRHDLTYNKNSIRITLENGSVIQGDSVENLDPFRGSNLSGAWLDDVLPAGKLYDQYIAPAIRIAPKKLVYTSR